MQERCKALWCGRNVSSKDPKATESKHAVQHRPVKNARLFAHRAEEREIVRGIPFIRKLNFQPMMYTTTHKWV